MVNEIITSTTDYIKTRLTNPFLGTLLVVWFVRNFEFLFALCNFAEGVTLTQKVDYIRRYFKLHGDRSHFWENVEYAVLLMLLGFIFLLVTRLVTNGYTLLLNELNKRTDRGSVVSREQFNNLESLFSNLKAEKESLKIEVQRLENIEKEYIESKRKSVGPDAISRNRETPNPTPINNPATQAPVFYNGLGTLDFDNPLIVENIRNKTQLYISSAEARKLTQRQREFIDSFVGTRELLDLVKLIYELKYDNGREYYYKIEDINLFKEADFIQYAFDSRSNFKEIKGSELNIMPVSNSFFGWVTDLKTNNT